MFGLAFLLSSGCVSSSRTISGLEVSEPRASRGLVDPNPSPEAAGRAVKAFAVAENASSNLVAQSGSVGVVPLSGPNELATADVSGAEPGVGGVVKSPTGSVRLC